MLKMKLTSIIALLLISLPLFDADIKCSNGNFADIENGGGKKSCPPVCAAYTCNGTVRNETDTLYHITSRDIGCAEDFFNNFSAFIDQVEHINASYPYDSVVAIKYVCGDQLENGFQKCVLEKPHNRQKENVKNVKNGSKEVDFSNGLFPLDAFTDIPAFLSGTPELVENVSSLICNAFDVFTDIPALLSDAPEFVKDIFAPSKPIKKNKSIVAPLKKPVGSAVALTPPKLFNIPIAAPSKPINAASLKRFASTVVSNSLKHLIGSTYANGSSKSIKNKSTEKLGSTDALDSFKHLIGSTIAPLKSLRTSVAPDSSKLNGSNDASSDSLKSIFKPTVVPSKLNESTDANDSSKPITKSDVTHAPSKPVIINPSIVPSKLEPALAPLKSVRSTDAHSKPIINSSVAPTPSKPINSTDNAVKKVRFIQMLRSILALGVIGVLSMFYLFVLSIVVYVFLKDYFADRFDAETNEHFRDLLRKIQNEHKICRPKQQQLALPSTKKDQEQQTDGDEEEAIDDNLELPALGQCSSEVDVSMDDTISHSCA